MSLVLDRGRQVRSIRADYIKCLNLINRDFIFMIYKSIYRSEYTSIKFRWKLSYFLNLKTFGVSNLKRRCVCRLTGRSHFVIHFAGLSRFEFRRLAGVGLLCGVARYGK